MPASGCCALTQTEREVVRAILKHGSVKSAASNEGRNIQTARVHVRAIHEKTGTHTLVELAGWAGDHRPCCVDERGAAPPAV
jgi:DNA-binding CsgD family transcriptional regulator